jgi:cbb3-type cytochrome oxidase cytochrome c subunit
MMVSFTPARRFAEAVEIRDFEEMIPQSVISLSGRNLYANNRSLVFAVLRMAG